MKLDVIGYTRHGKAIYRIAGGAPTVAELEKQRDDVVTEAQELLASFKGETPDEEGGKKLRGLDENFQALEKQITEAGNLQSTSDRFRAAAEEKEKREEKLRTEQRPALYGDDQGDELKKFLDQPITPGEMFTRSEAYSKWMAQYPNGGPSMEGAYRSTAEDVGAYSRLLNLHTATEKLRGVLTPAKFRSLVTASDSSAGTLVNSLRRGLIEPGLVRPLTVRDLLTVLPVTTDTIEYVREASRISNAAPTEEASALTGTSGTKPEGGLAFESASDTVKTIAEWVPVTKRILADAPQLRAYIDSYLSYDLALELEDQIVSGSGGGENFTGILNTTNVLTQTGGDTMLDDLRAAKRKIRVGGRTTPNGILMNPEDTETLDLLRAHNTADTAGSYNFLGSNPFAYTGNDRVWAMPIVESEAVDPGTVLVGDFTRAILFDRESTGISVGTAGDDFIRNIVRVLAELRAGFGVIRPTAFCIVTL